MVYDLMFSQKIKLESYEPPLDLIKSYNKAYSRYAEALMSCAALKKEEEVSGKQKLVMENIAEVKQRKANIEECSSCLRKEADELSILAQKKQDFTALAKANSFCAVQKDKRDEIIKLEKVIDKMEIELKQLKWHFT